MVFRNKDPCEPCRAKKIRCIHNLPQNTSPKPATSPIPIITPRKTRQAMEKPSTVNLGDIPVFESQEGLDALATISNNNLGARDITPDLLETCSTKPVVIPRKRRFFRESPPTKSKKQKLDGSPRDAFESEIQVSVPAWITEKLKSISDFPSPAGARGSKLNFKNILSNRRKSIDSSNSSIHCPSIAESEKEENAKKSKSGLNGSASKAGHSSTTATSTEVIGCTITSSLDGGTVEHGPNVNEDMGRLSLMSPLTPKKMQDGLAETGVGGLVEVEGRDPSIMQVDEEGWERVSADAKGAPELPQQIRSKLDAPELEEINVLPNGKGPEEKRDLPVESESNHSGAADMPDKELSGINDPGSKEPSTMNKAAKDENLSQKTNHPEKAVVGTHLDEHGSGNHRTQEETPQDASDGDVHHEVGGALGGYKNISQGVEAGAFEKKGLTVVPEQGLLETLMEDTTQVIVNFQQSQNAQQENERCHQPDTLSRSYGSSPKSHATRISPMRSTGTSHGRSPTPWNATPRDESLITSDGSVNGLDTRRRLWRKDHIESAAIRDFDRARWRDPAAGPSRFSGPRIFTPLRSAPLEPGMGLVDPTRYSQHEGLWNLVTNDYLDKFKRPSTEKKRETL